MRDDPKRRSDAERNREAIVSAALDALAESPDASLNAIAKRANVANATLYRHFPTREQLVLAVYESEVRHLVEAADELLDRSEPERGTPTVDCAPGPICNDQAWAGERPPGSNKSDRRGISGHLRAHCRRIGETPRRSRRGGQCTTGTQSLMTSSFCLPAFGRWTRLPTGNRNQHASTGLFSRGCRRTRRRAEPCIVGRHPAGRLLDHWRFSNFTGGPAAWSTCSK